MYYTYYITYRYIYGICIHIHIATVYVAKDYSTKVTKVANFKALGNLLGNCQGAS